MCHNRYCQRWQSCEVRKILTYTFKCRTCEKSRKFKKTNQLGLSMDFHGPYPSPYKVNLIIAELNKQIFKAKEQ